MFNLIQTNTMNEKSKVVSVQLIIWLDFICFYFLKFQFNYRYLIKVASHAPCNFGHTQF